MNCRTFQVINEICFDNDPNISNFYSNGSKFVLYE